MQTSNRPVFLNLLKIRLPLTGWVSIAHRLTGFGLFLLLPIPLYFWQLSLTGPEDFQLVQSWFGTMPVRLLLLLLFWWFFHHFVSGLRFLFVDLDVGVSLSAARRSATWVLLADGVFLVGGLWLL